MRTDCFGILGCSRVFWMSFPQENANSTLNKTNSHDAFMFMTNFLERLLVSIIIGQALYTTTDLWFLVLCLKSLNSILHSFEAFVSYHWGYTHARSCKIWDFWFETFSWHSRAQLKISDFLFSQPQNLPFFLSFQKIAKNARLAIFPFHWKIF